MAAALSSDEEHKQAAAVAAAPGRASSAGDHEAELLQHRQQVQDMHDMRNASGISDVSSSTVECDPETEPPAGFTEDSAAVAARPPAPAQSMPKDHQPVSETSIAMPANRVGSMMEPSEGDKQTASHDTSSVKRPSNDSIPRPVVKSRSLAAAPTGLLREAAGSSASPSLAHMPASSSAMPPAASLSMRSPVRDGTASYSGPLPPLLPAARLSLRSSREGTARGKARHHNRHAPGASPRDSSGAAPLMTTPGRGRVLSAVTHSEYLPATAFIRGVAQPIRNSSVQRLLASGVRPVSSKVLSDRTFVVPTNAQGSPSIGTMLPFSATAPPTTAPPTTAPPNAMTMMMLMPPDAQSAFSVAHPAGPPAATALPDWSGPITSLGGFPAGGAPVYPIGLPGGPSGYPAAFGGPPAGNPNFYSSGSGWNYPQPGAPQISPRSPILQGMPGQMSPHIVPTHNPLTTTQQQQQQPHPYHAAAVEATLRPWMTNNPTEQRFYNHPMAEQPMNGQPVAPGPMATRPAAMMSGQHSSYPMCGQPQQQQQPQLQDLSAQGQMTGEAQGHPSFIGSGGAPRLPTWYPAPMQQLEGRQTFGGGAAPYGTRLPPAPHASLEAGRATGLPSPQSLPPSAAQAPVLFAQQSPPALLPAPGRPSVVGSPPLPTQLSPTVTSPSQATAALGKAAATTQLARPQLPAGGGTSGVFTNQHQLGTEPSTAASVTVPRAAGVPFAVAGGRNASADANNPQTGIPAVSTNTITTTTTPISTVTTPDYARSAAAVLPGAQRSSIVPTASYPHTTSPGNNNYDARRQQRPSVAAEAPRLGAFTTAAQQQQPLAAGAANPDQHQWTGQPVAALQPQQPVDANYGQQPRRSTMPHETAPGAYVSALLPPPPNGAPLQDTAATRGSLPGTAAPVPLPSAELHRPPGSLTLAQPSQERLSCVAGTNSNVPSKVGTEIWEPKNSFSTDIPHSDDPAAQLTHTRTPPLHAAAAVPSTALQQPLGVAAVHPCESHHLPAAEGRAELRPRKPHPFLSSESVQRLTQGTRRRERGITLSQTAEEEYDDDYDYDYDVDGSDDDETCSCCSCTDGLPYSNGAQLPQKASQQQPHSPRDVVVERRIVFHPYDGENRGDDYLDEEDSEEYEGVRSLRGRAAAGSGGAPSPRKIRPGERANVMAPRDARNPRTNARGLPEQPGYRSAAPAAPPQRRMMPAARAAAGGPPRFPAGPRPSPRGGADQHRMMTSPRRGEQNPQRSAPAGPARPLAAGTSINAPPQQQKSPARVFCPCW